MKKTIKIASIALMMCVMGVVLTACGGGGTTPPGTNWINPMVAVNFDDATKTGTQVLVGITDGTTMYDTRTTETVSNPQNVYGKAAKVMPGFVIGDATGKTPQQLVALGAVRMTTKVEYKGADIDIRLGASVQEFSGHDLNQSVIVSNNDVLVLWRAIDGQWHNIRGSAGRRAIGQQLNGNDDFTLNGDTVSKVADMEFYIVVTRSTTLLDRPAAAGRNAGFDSFGGFVVTFIVEQGDAWHNHFHRYEVLGAASSALLVEQPAA